MTNTSEQPLMVARTADADEANPYLLGVFVLVSAEIDAEDLQVIGENPKDLNGVKLRNGPKPRIAPEGRYHWYDGDGMIHAVHLENGKARHRNRWVRTKAFEAESEAGKGLWTGVMESPKGNPFGNTHGLGLKDNANTDVVFHRGRILATWYLCGSPYGVDPLSLETLGAEDFLGTLGGDMMAHPKVDEATGELFWVAYGPRPPYLRFVVICVDGQVVKTTENKQPGPRLPHDMAITEHHAVLMDLPLVQDLEAAKQARHKLRFDRSMPSRFGVLPRNKNGSQIKWFDASPCYIYHVVNAWEEGEEVILDVCRVRQPAPRADAHTPLAKMLSYLRHDAQLHRYRFNLRTGACHEAALDDANTEFPTVDSRRVGRGNRYSYAVHISPESTLKIDGLVRYDNLAGSKTEYRFGPGRWGSEAPFAPRDGVAADSADGYLVTFVQDEREGRSELDIFDAADLAAGPVARVLLPQRVPLGFHATWVRADQLENLRS